MSYSVVSENSMLMNSNKGSPSNFSCGTFLPLFHGQFISLLIAGTGFFASLLSSQDVNTPMLQSLLNYVLLSTYLVRLAYKQSASNKKNHAGTSACQLELQWPWWMYLGVALLDVEANVLVVTAYQYTSITSIMLLDCFSIPCVMLLSRIFLRAKYRPQHVAGVVICISGLVLTVVSDILQNGSEAKPKGALYGDILCLIAACLYACSNVIQESMVKDRERMEFLGMLGVFGVVIAGIQMSIFEMHIIAAVHWRTDTICYLLGFVLCLFLVYANMSAFLSDSDSGLFNLSLLTSDVYAVIFAYFVYHYQVHWLYYIAFLLSGTGLYCYHAAGQPTADTSYNALEKFAENRQSESGFNALDEEDIISAIESVRSIS